MHERAATAADAVAGVVPKRVVSPETLDEAALYLYDSASRDEAIAFVGGRSELDLGTAPRRLDTVLQTSGLARLVEYAPADQIVTAEAGMTLATLQGILAPHRQRLAIDPPQAERATLGGLIATNAHGPLRTRYGSLRDLIIGAAFVRADGTRVKAGGKVVKNVAGFDLPKLLVGSLGTLAMLGSATFRVHPLPESEETLLSGASTPRDIWHLNLALKKAQLEPSAIVALDEADGFRLALRFEGFAPGVVEQRSRALTLLRQTGGQAELLQPARARTLWQEEARLRSEGRVRVKLAATPAKLAIVCGTRLSEPSNALFGARTVWYPRLGLAFLSLAPSPADNQAASRALLELRKSLEAQAGSLTLSAAPTELKTSVGVWGSKPAAFPLMLRVKERFDPALRLNPGRFVGDI